jgi:hypothetical protein
MSTDGHVAMFNLVLMIIRSEDFFVPKLHFHATEKNWCLIIKLARNFTPPLPTTHPQTTWIKFFLSDIDLLMFSLSTDHFMHFEIDELDFLFLFPILNEYTRYIIDTYRNKRNNFFSKLDQNLKAVNVHSVVQDYAAILKTL